MPRSPVSTIYEQLVSYWKATGLKIAEPVHPSQLQLFETQNDIKLPEDFRMYYRYVNGMVQEGGHDCDKKGFSFWPLAQIRRVPDECSEQSVPVPDIDDPNQYFVFADYLQWSWAYAIRLSRKAPDPSPIIHVGTLEPKVVAQGFSDFVKLYMSDSEELYPRSK